MEGPGENGSAFALTRCRLTEAKAQKVEKHVAVRAKPDELSWPDDHTGWNLLVQTNNLASGISGNVLDWAVVPGSATTNRVLISIDAAKPAQFYKMQYQTGP